MKIDEALLKDLASISEAFPEDAWLASMAKATKEGDRKLLRSIGRCGEITDGLQRGGVLDDGGADAVDTVCGFAEGVYRKALAQYASFKHQLKMLEEGIDPEGLALWMEASGKDRDTLLTETKAATAVMKHIIAYWIDEFDEARSRHER